MKAICTTTRWCWKRAAAASCCSRATTWSRWTSRTRATPSRRWSRWATTASSAGVSSTACWKKEAYSDYVFEDLALEMLEAEPELKAAFEQWKAANPGLLSDQAAVLDFIFENGKRHHEPEWRRYPVLSIL